MPRGLLGSYGGTMDHISPEAFEEAERKGKEIAEQMNADELMSQLLHSSPAVRRLGISKYNWWNEGLHGAARSGTATVFPQAIGLAAAFDSGMMERIGDAVSTEQRAKYNTLSRLGDRGIYKGLTVWSPNINIFRDPRWGRGQETYGEDPYLASVLAVAFIRGLQGTDPHRLKTAACVKHFVAHSGPEPERHHFNASVSPRDMEETYLPAFEAAVREGHVNGVMGAYSEINGEPCCCTHLIEDLIRRKWGFRGIFISDCWAIRDFHEQHHYTSSPEESAAAALKVGCDLNCGCTYSYLGKALSKGLISKDDLRRSAGRLFTTRTLLGEFGEAPYSSIGFEEIASERHRLLSEEASEKSLVLLRNDGLLPLDRNTGRIAVIGPNADSRIALWGNYHGTSMRYTTVLEGMRELAGKDTRIFYAEGSALTADHVERLGEKDDRIAEAVAAAEASDAAVLCLGYNESIEGEMHDDGNGGIAGDRKDLRLPPPQRRLLQRVAETGCPIVLVLFSGGGIDPEIEGMPSVRAVIQAWYPGEAGGKAVAELIFGLINPSGRLPVTFCRADSQLPDYASYSMKGRTYRFMEEKPLYPFAFGLSYTSFRYSDPSFDKERRTFSFTLRNTGDMDGEEVSFVWCSLPDDKDSTPNPRLAGFARTMLRAGEEKRVDIILDERFQTLVGDDGSRTVRHGRWELSAAGSQCDEYSLSLTGGNAAAITAEL